MRSQVMSRRSSMPLTRSFGMSFQRYQVTLRSAMRAPARRPRRGVAPLLVELRDAKRRFEMLRLGPAVEARRVLENQPLGDDASGDVGVLSDVDHLGRDELSGKSTE